MADLAAKIDALEATLQKASEQLAELKALTDGRPTAGQEAKRVLDGFVKLWDQRYKGAHYVVSGAKDIASLKRVLASGLSGDEILRRARKFLASTEPFYAQARHPLPMFVAAVNKFAEASLLIDDLDDEEAAVDCRHRPPCRSAAEHTKRVMADHRGAR